jgi:DNA-binding MarR family transcriptional regulator
MASTPSTDSDLAAFSAVLDDFLAATRRARGRLGADQELTLSQYHLLRPLLDGAEPLGVCALAEAAGVSAPTATRALVVLERDGLVERRADADDRRKVRIALTDEGLHRVAAKHDRSERRREQIYRSLTPSERQTTTRVLARLAAAIEDLK